MIQEGITVLNELKSQALVEVLTQEFSDVHPGLCRCERCRWEMQEVLALNARRAGAA
jgi:hypothetical protein